MTIPIRFDTNNSWDKLGFMEGLVLGEGSSWALKPTHMVLKKKTHGKLISNQSERNIYIDIEQLIESNRNAATWWHDSSNALELKFEMFFKRIGIIIWDVYRDHGWESLLQPFSMKIEIEGKVWMGVMLHTSKYFTKYES